MPHDDAFSIIPTPTMGEEELRSLVRCYTTKINACYMYLRDTIETEEQGTAIEQKWNQMCLVHRHNILDIVWSALPYSERADIGLYMENSNPTPESLYGSPYACPINARSLTMDGNLPCLLKSRSRNAPGKFVRRDLLDYPFHVLTKPQIPSWGDNFCMLLEDPDTLGRVGDHYGALVPLETVTDPWRPGRQNRVYHCFEGVAVLRSQVWTYFVLEQCCRKILADDGDRPAPLDTSAREEKLPSLVKAAVEAPYEPCSTILDLEDLEWVQLLISAQYNAAVDHLNGLRGDPLYYCRTIKEHLGHVLQPTRDEDGNFHSEWERPPPDMRSVLAWSIIPANEEVFMWHILYSLMGDVLKATNIIPPLLTLRAHLAFVAHCYLDRLSDTIMTGSLAMESCIRGRSTPGNTNLPSIVLRADGIQDEDLLTVLMICIPVLRRRRDFQMINPATIISSIGIALDRSAAVKKHVSRYNDSRLSTLAILFSCIERIDLALPNAATNDEPILPSFKASQDKLDSLEAGLSFFNKLSPKTVELGDPYSGDRFNFPENASNKREAVERMIRAEEALEMFWSGLKEQLWHVSTFTAKGIEALRVPEQSLPQTAPWAKSREKPLPNGKKGKKSKLNPSAGLLSAEIAGNTEIPIGYLEQDKDSDSTLQPDRSREDLGIDFPRICESGSTPQPSRSGRDSEMKYSRNSESDSTCSDVGDEISLAVERPINTPRWFSALKPWAYDDSSLHNLNHDEPIDPFLISAKHGISDSTSALVKKYIDIRQRWLAARRDGLFAPRKKARLEAVLETLSFELSRELESPGVVARIGDMIVSTRVDMKMVQGAYDGGNSEQLESESESEIGIAELEAPDPPVPQVKPKPKKGKKAKSKATPAPAPAPDEAAWEEIDRLAAENEAKRKEEFRAEKSAIEKPTPEKPTAEKLVIESEQLVELDGRHRSVFKTLLWVPGQPIPTLFKWQDFIDALESIGFKPDHLYGSLWLFIRDGRGVLFQEAPYNAASSRNMSLATARNYGRRLQGMFGLEFKQCDEQGEVEG